MIALIVIGAVLALILVVLFLPVSVFLRFDDDFFVKVSFAKIKLFGTGSEKKKSKYKPKHTAKKSEKEPENAIIKEGKQLFSFLKKKYGFAGAAKAVLTMLKDMLTHIKKLLRHIKFRRVELDISVTAEDAAQTAIAYGKICSAAYPILAFLNSYARIGFKRIDIKSDFNGNTPEFKFSADVRLQVIFLLIAAYGVYSEYKKFILKENLNERK